MCATAIMTDWKDVFNINIIDVMMVKLNLSGCNVVNYEHWHILMTLII